MLANSYLPGNADILICEKLKERGSFGSRKSQRWLQGIDFCQSA
jgi:hypothetical protein